MQTDKLTAALGKKSVPEIACACDDSKRAVDLVAVLELKAGVARGVGNQPIAVNVVDSPTMFHFRQIRTPGTHSCKPRQTSHVNEQDTESDTVNPKTLSYTCQRHAIRK